MVTVKISHLNYKCKLSWYLTWYVFLSCHISLAECKTEDMNVIKFLNEDSNHAFSSLIHFMKAYFLNFQPLVLWYVLRAIILLLLEIILVLVWLRELLTFHQEVLKLWIFIISEFLLASLLSLLKIKICYYNILVKGQLKSNKVFWQKCFSVQWANHSCFWIHA